MRICNFQVPCFGYVTMASFLLMLTFRILYYCICNDDYKCNLSDFVLSVACLDNPPIRCDRVIIVRLYVVSLLSQILYMPYRVRTFLLSG